MKRLTSLFVLFWVSTLAVAAVQPPEALELEPQLEQRFATNLATRFLTNWHYKDTRLDDDLSSRIFDKYIELLDPNRNYFLASDIEGFERYRDNLDDALRHSDLQPAYDVFNVYVNRVRERIDYSVDAVHQPMDFTVDEYYEFDRSEASWAESRAELDELWRKRVKNDYLRLLLTDKEPEAIVETLEERYANMTRRINELKTEDVFQFFMNAFAQSIEPHTSYLSPRTSENFEISMKLSLEGIGALLGRVSEYTTIASVVPGGPADQDGRLQAGDRIIAVGQENDGKLVDVIGWRIDDVVQLIRGPKGSVVRLEVLPEDVSISGPSTVIDIVRNEVKLEEQAAKSRVLEVPVEESEEPVRIGVIDLPVFYLDFNGRAQNRPDYRSSTRDVRRLIGELKEQGVAGLVIDLRDNGGGSLLEATTLTGLFIDKGPVVQVRNSNGRISLEEDVDAGMAWDGPLAVLVNRYSASASEIFAAAIQDYGRGLVIGEPTFGKGTVQSLLDLDDYAPSSDSPSMGQLKITMAQFFRVNGGSTQNRGVIPDIRFPSAGDPAEYGESSLDNALPWSSIDPARYQPAGDLSRLVAVAENRFEGRIVNDEEYNWLLADIEEYNRKSGRTRVSLLESEARAEMEREEERLKNRKAKNGEAESLVENTEIPDGSEFDNLTDEEAAEDDDENDGPDLLLREAAEIVADVAELESDMELLNRQFSQLPPNGKKGAAPQMN
ncbi:carboxy terminal-processing peptidase [Elongatibacter sediminis]|uniref:Carboxy terminal-processing peptidase n=1 Tax=Elongatibacter sediminis TaxID=3119006 RepID=A0AAW9RH04_9GAMM